MLVLDFETLPITTQTRRTGRPPEPVGMALDDTYYHWGHVPVERWRGQRGVDARAFERVGRPLKAIVPTTRQSAARTLREAVARADAVLCHNALFDVQIALDHMGVRRAALERLDVHDTAWLLFLVDPNAPSMSLKPSAERWLGLEPGAQDRMKDWLVEHVGARTPHERDVLGMPTPKESPSAWTAFAPPRIAGRYALDDLRMTRGLFKKLAPLVDGWRMGDAYRRYQRAFWAILDMQRRGVRVDGAEAARQDEALLVGAEECEAWIRRRLDRPDLNMNSPKQMREALESAAVMDERRWLQYQTDTGELSTSKLALEACCADPQLRGAITYLNKATFNRQTFTSKWVQVKDERWFVDYSLTRSDTGGARTGRLATTPNVMNLSKHVPAIVTTQRDAAKLAKVGAPHIVLDHHLAKRVPPLPALRRCIVPGHRRAFADLDYAQQELRVLAEYAGGSLARAYHADAGTDMHAYAGAEIARLSGRTLGRTFIKNIAFGIIYGSGLRKQTQQVGGDPDNRDEVEAMREMRGIYYAAMPEVEHLQSAWTNDPQYNVTTAKLLTPRRGTFGRPVPLEPVYTIGGRICFVEEPAYSKKLRKMLDFQYKLPNTAVQGSAGDQLVEAIILMHEAGIDIVAPVHDQTLIEDEATSIEATAREAARIMERAAETFERPLAGGGTKRFSIPMIADYDIRLENWAERE